MTDTRDLTVAMGGHLGVESEPGKRSRFWIDLPRSNVKAAPEDAQITEISSNAPSATSFAHLGRVLVAEDNLGNQRLIQRILKLWGVEIDIASDGQEAIAM